MIYVSSFSWIYVYFWTDPSWKYIQRGKSAKSVVLSPLLSDGSITTLGSDILLKSGSRGNKTLF